MKKFRITEKNKKIISVLIIVALIAFTVLVCYFIGVPLVKFVKEPEKFRALVDELGICGYLLYLLIQMFQVIFALIPGEPFEILAGYSFGSIWGTFLCILGSTIGSSIVFFLARKFGVKFVEIFFPREKIDSIKFLHDKTKMYFLTFLLFFIPGTPKDLISYVAGLTPIKFLPYILISTIAKIPSIITSTVGGDAIGEQKYTFAIIAFLITGIISFIGILIYNKITNKK